MKLYITVFYISTAILQCSSSDSDVQAYFIQKYDITRPKYGAAVNRSAHVVDSPAHTFAYLIANRRTVILYSFQQLKENLYESLLARYYKIVSITEQEDDAFVNAIKEGRSEWAKFTEAIAKEGIREYQGLSFRSEGERAALLYLKYTRASGLPRNDYVEGSLLGYDLEDIEFYYHRHAFIEYGDAIGLFESREIHGCYAKFTDAQKKAFNFFMQHKWLTSDGKKRFEKHRDEGQRWLAEQEHETISSLYEQLCPILHMHAEK